MFTVAGGLCGLQLQLFTAGPLLGCPGSGVIDEDFAALRAMPRPENAHG